MNKRKIAKIQRRMLLLIFTVFSLLALLFFLLIFLLLRYQVFSIDYISEQNSLTIIAIIVALTIFSQGATIVWVNRISRPVNGIIEVIEEVSKGNFDLRIDSSKFKDEMLELANTLNSMIEKLNNIEVMRSDFVSNVSHEFKAPLSSIQGSVTLLSNPKNSPEQQEEYMSLLKNATSQFSTLVDNVLRLSKLESDNVELKVKRFWLDEQIRRVVLIYEHVWIERDIDIDLELEKCDYLGAEELFHHVWMNLIGNAVKYVPDGGKIKITLDNSNEQYVEVSVADNGPGMTKQVSEHVFEKFYQGDSSHKSSGNGLGLALVKSVCNLTGSKVRVESELGRGSRFVVKMPK